MLSLVVVPAVVKTFSCHSKVAFSTEYICLIRQVSIKVEIGNKASHSGECVLMAPCK